MLLTQAGLVRGGQRGTKYWGPSCFEGPVTSIEWPRSRKTFFFRDTREEMEKLRLCYAKTFFFRDTRKNFGEITSSFAMQSWTRVDFFDPSPTPLSEPAPNPTKELKARFRPEITLLKRSALC